MIVGQEPVFGKGSLVRRESFEVAVPAHTSLSHEEPNESPPHGPAKDPKRE
jgi:hypothetical protein